MLHICIYIHGYIYACICGFVFICTCIGMYMCVTHVCLCAGVCMYVYILYVFIYIYIYVCVFVYVYICMCVCIDVCICSICICLYIYIFMYLCIDIYIYIYIYMYMYMCICVYIPMYIYHICSIFWSLLYLDTTDTRRSIWCSQDNAKPHENRRSNPWTYTPIKTHIHIIMNKSPLPTKPMHIFILQIHDQFHKNIHLPIQPKCDTQPLQSHTN